MQTILVHLHIQVAFSLELSYSFLRQTYYSAPKKYMKKWLEPPCLLRAVPVYSKCL